MVLYSQEVSVPFAKLQMPCNTETWKMDKCFLHKYSFFIIWSWVLCNTFQTGEQHFFDILICICCLSNIAILSLFLSCVSVIGWPALTRLPYQTSSVSGHGQFHHSSLSGYLGSYRCYHRLFQSKFLTSGVKYTVCVTYWITTFNILICWGINVTHYKAEDNILLRTTLYSVCKQAVHTLIALQKRYLDSLGKLSAAEEDTIWQVIIGQRAEVSC